MSKALLAFVWIAGPLSGTLVQPYVGIRSDNSRIKYGKRVPFMLSGAFATAISLLALAWTREIVHGFLGLFGAEPDSHGVQVCSIVWAIIFVYILDFAINTGKFRASRRLVRSLTCLSPGWCTRFHRRQCAHASTRRCQRLGGPNNRCGQHSWIPFWICPSSFHLPMARAYSIPSTLLNRLRRPLWDSHHIMSLRSRA